MNGAVKAFLDEKITVSAWDPGASRTYSVEIPRREAINVGSLHRLKINDIIELVVIPLLALLAEVTDDGLDTMLRVSAKHEHDDLP